MAGLQLQEEKPGAFNGSALPASEVRITTQELVEALAAIESRSSDTIKVGDAIRDLGLSISAEEILAAVAERKASLQQPRRRSRFAMAVEGVQARLKRSMSRRRTRITAVAAGVLVLAGFFRVFPFAPFGYWNPTWNPTYARVNRSNFHPARPVLAYSDFVKAVESNRIQYATWSPTEIDGTFKSGLSFYVDCSQVPLTERDAVLAKLETETNEVNVINR